MNIFSHRGYWKKPFQKNTKTGIKISLYQEDAYPE